MSSEYARLTNLIRAKESELRTLKSQKKALDEKLLQEMQSRKLEHLNGIRKSDLVKAPRISTKEKEKMIVDKLGEFGVQNPQIVAEELKKVGKKNKTSNK